ncbi:MAG TPA: hypothetical protein VER36_06295 [Flavisolibacter sp.]|nr:hypothetical protein [Flavisolibacter sp.]
MKKPCFSASVTYLQLSGVVLKPAATDTLHYSNSTLSPTSAGYWVGSKPSKNEIPF